MDLIGTRSYYIRRCITSEQKEDNLDKQTSSLVLREKSWNASGSPGWASSLLLTFVLHPQHEETALERGDRSSLVPATSC